MKIGDSFIVYNSGGTSRFLIHSIDENGVVYITGERNHHSGISKIRPFVTTILNFQELIKKNYDPMQK